MRRHVPILVVLAVAAVARYWAIDFCLPSPYCRPDEEAVAAVTLGFLNRHLNPSFFDWPPLFMYGVTLGLVPYFKVGRALGWFHSEYHFLQSVATFPGPIFLWARVLSAAAGVASVWLVHRIALRLLGRQVALVAAAFLALAFLPVRDAHFGVTDVAASAMVLVSVLCAARLFESGAWRDLALAGVTAGLAVATKYNSAVVVLPAVYAAIAGAGSARLSGRARVTRVLGFVAIAICSYAAVAPYSFIEFEKFRSAMLGVSAHLDTGHGVDLGRGWVHHLTTSLRYGLGLPLLVAGVTGVLWMTIARGRQGVLLALFPVVYYAGIGRGLTVFARYILPVIPFLCMAAAFAVCQTAAWIAARTERQAWRAGMAGVIAGAVLAPAAWSVWQFNALLGREDSRVLAAAWVQRQLPAGAHIVETGRLSVRLFFPPDSIDRPSRYTIVGADSTGWTADPELLVIAGSPLVPDAEIPATAVALAKRYVRVFSVAAFAPASANTYDWQDEFYLPLSGFAGITRPGPNLEIYARPDIALTLAPAGVPATPPATSR